MAYGTRKGLEDIAFELRGVKNILSAIWSSRYQSEETDQIHPDLYADEYISTEECARRLGVSDQTIRNWILTGKKKPTKGWVQNVHYVNISPDPGKKDVIRIPWNQLIVSFAKNNQVSLYSFRSKNMYADTAEKRFGTTPLKRTEEATPEEDKNEEQV